MRQNWNHYFGNKFLAKRVREKPAELKYIGLVVLLSFLFGVLGVNLMGQKNGFDTWNTYFVEQFKYARIQPRELFYYVLEERFPLMLLLLLFMAAGKGMAAGTLFLSWQSFSAGFLMASAVISYGGKGILLMGTALFPHYLVYVPLYVGYLYLSVFFRGWGRRKETETGADYRIREIRGETGHRITIRKDYLFFGVSCLLVLSIYMTGIFLESYVNPYLLKKILKIF